MYEIIFHPIFHCLVEFFKILFIFYMITTITMNKVSLFCTCLARTCNWLITKIYKKQRNHWSIQKPKCVVQEQKACKFTDLGLGLSRLPRPFKRWLQKGANPPTAYFTTQPFTAACKCKQVG